VSDHPPRKNTMINISIKEKVPFVYLDRGILGVLNGNLIFSNKDGSISIPIGIIHCIFIGPGSSISHDAIKLISNMKCLIIWCDGSGLKLYSNGFYNKNNTDKLIHQVLLSSDENKRCVISKKMFKLRFNKDIIESVSLNQLRGMEGYEVKLIYANLSENYHIKWNGRDFSGNDLVNKCLNIANSYLYGIVESAIMISGYHPSIGFMHSGYRSFVYDIADLFKFHVTVPIAFDIASQNIIDCQKIIQMECMKVFNEEKLLRQLIPTINMVLDQ